MIAVKNLEKYFNKGKRNELHVLDGINVEFENRGLVCILGESGSGKTTLLNTIGGLDTFASGNIDIDGNVFKKYSAKGIEKVRNDTFGYIFQNYYLLQDYTVLYNVKLALNTYDITEEEKEERALYVLEKLDMVKYKKKLVSQLSGGQQQRVSIARALVKSPKIILADEPTGNLDEENTLRTMSILKSIAKECLVILVSHEKRIANFFADRIIEIADGKIVNDYRNKNSDSYQRMDDGNIYLKDLECTTLEKEGVQIQLYQDEKSCQEKINLNFAWKNGKLYIQNLEDYDVLLAGTEVGCEMLDTHKPNVEMTNVEEFDFSLPRLKEHTVAKLSRKEIWKLALENIRLMGKKQAFIIGILLVTAVMLTITLANFTNNFFINEREVITEDSHYITVDASSIYEDMEDEYTEEFANFCEDYAFAGKHGAIYKSNGGSLSLRYDGFVQLQSAGLEFKEFSYVSLEHVEEKDILFGRLPKTKDEIVVDKWLIDKTFDTNSPFHHLIQDTESFINQELISAVSGDIFKIVGISDKGQPSIYMDKYKAIGLSKTGYRIANIEQLQAEYPRKYENQSLGSCEVMVTESAMRGYERRKTKTIKLENGREYKIVGAFPDAFGVDYVLSDEDCQEIYRDYILKTKGYQIYTEEPEKMIKQVKADIKDYDEYFTASVFSKSKMQIKQHEKANEENISSRNLFAVAAVFVSVFMIYFMIKSNVSSRTEELTVYRLLGIEKGSIIKSYLLEMFLVTSYTVLPAVLITSGIIKFVSSIPSLELQLIFPWWAAVALILAMYLINLIISVIPVNSTLSKPPAALAVNKL